jgi:acyl-CoA reductase-like NAD-dependent aldehyde dehydrogenase
MKTYQMFIGGQWVDSLSKATFDDMNPYTGELYAKVAKGDATGNEEPCNLSLPTLTWNTR